MTPNNYFYKTALLLLLFIYQSSFPQEKYHITWYSADSNHLPQNSVKSITPDKYGFLWLSTENGIVRYDGQNFKTYNGENVKNLTANRMRVFNGSIHKDSIIIINEKGETLLIHERSVKRIPNATTVNTAFNNIGKKTYIPYYPFLYTVSDKNYAFSSQENIFTLKNDIITQYNRSFKPIKQFNYTYKDSSQFFAINGLLYQLGHESNYASCTANPVTYKKFDRPFSKNARIYSNTIAGQTFIYSNKSLYYIKEINGKLTTKLIFDDFDCYSNNIASVYYDTQNEIIFLGSTNKGLLIAKKKIFNHNATKYHHPSGTDDVYYALTPYTNNSVLTSTGEIFHKNGQTSIIDIGSYTDKYTLIIDNNGDVWTKEHEMLYCFKKNSNFKESVRWELKNSISTIAKGLDGHIYISIFNKGKKRGILYKIDPSKKSAKPELLFEMDIACSDIKIIDQNTLWAGSWDGLYKIHLKQKRIEKIKGLDKVHVRSIYAPNNNETWICTYNKGMYLLKNNKITLLPSDRKGYLLTAHCIVEDKQGFFWITSNKGIFQVKKQDLYNFAENKLKNVYYHVYDKSAGFINNEFNGGCSPCGVYLNLETIFFPSMDGVVYYKPTQIKERTPSSNIYIDEISIDGKKQKTNSSLALNRNFERIQFFVTSPFYGNAYNQNIDTKLEGPIIQDWTPMDEDNVSFSTLPPGNYILKARKLSGFGSKYIYTSIKFCITPAFWQTKAFTIIVMILILLFAYTLFRLRIRYIKHKNIQLEKQIVLKTKQLHDIIAELRKTKDDLSTQVTNHKTLIRTITHDIKSPLNFMVITGKFLYNNIENPNKTMKEDIKSIYTTSLQLYNFVDRFLEYAKEYDLNNNQSHSYNLNTLITEKITFFKNIATAGKTTLINSVDTKLMIVVNRHLLSIILHNLIDNAIKNTYEGQINIKASVKENLLNIIIEDNGYGMDTEMVKYYQDLSNGSFVEEKHNGIGLHIVIDLLVILEGALTITSQIDKGTSITISFAQGS